MDKERKSRIDNAFRAMKTIGFKVDKVKPVLKELLILNHKNWVPIEEENYRALADAIKKKEVEEHDLKKNVDDEAQDHSEEEAEESEPPLKRLKQEYPDGQTPSLTVSKAHASNMPCIKLNTALLREKLKNLTEVRRLGDETNRGSLLASNATTTEKTKAMKSLAELIIPESPQKASVTEAGAIPIISSTPLPAVSSSQVLLDSFPMSLRKELSGLDMLANEAAASEWHIAQALSHFASGAYSLVCAGEELKSNQASVTKLQAEATTLRFELAEANKAKATVVENLKTTQGNFQMLLEELEDVKADREAIQATLGKNREELKSSHATVSKLQVEACTFSFEVAEANKAKATVAENLKTAQYNYQTLVEELEDVKADREAIQATLGKTREGLKSSHATVSKLQAEATTLKFEVAEANKAKATAFEILKTTQSNFQTLFEELEDVKADRKAIWATLGKTREGLKSSHATVSKLQAEATAFRFEVAKANNAKAIVADNLKTAQSKFSTLLEELKDVKADRKAAWATLGKTRAQLANLQEESECEAVKLRSKLQAREQELMASKKELEVTKEELDAAKKGQTLEFNKLIQSEVFGPQRDTIEQVTLGTLVDTIRESHPEWDLSFLFSETKEEVVVPEVPQPAPSEPTEGG